MKKTTMEERYKAYSTMEKILYSVCSNHCGKMAGIMSISTSPYENARCLYRHDHGGKNCICTYCYSYRLNAARSTQKIKLKRNTGLYAYTDISYYDIPAFNTDVIRLESFGDLINTRHFYNYHSLAVKNSGVTFTLFTKNPGIIDNALAIYQMKVPENMIIIYSDPIIGDPAPAARYTEMLARYPFINKIFRVVRKDDPREYNNACGKACRACMMCYKKTDTVKVITEHLK